MCWALCFSFFVVLKSLCVFLHGDLQIKPRQTARIIFYWQRLLRHCFCKLVAQFQLTCHNIWVASMWYILGRMHAAFRGIWKLETIKPWACGLIWLLFHSEQGPGGNNDVTVRLVRPGPSTASSSTANIPVKLRCRCSVSLKLTILLRSSCKGGLPATPPTPSLPSWGLSWPTWWQISVSHSWSTSLDEQRPAGRRGKDAVGCKLFGGRGHRR